MLVLLCCDGVCRPHCAMMLLLMHDVQERVVIMVKLVIVYAEGKESLAAAVAANVEAASAEPLQCITVALKEYAPDSSARAIVAVLPSDKDDAINAQNLLFQTKLAELGAQIASIPSVILAKQGQHVNVLPALVGVMTIEPEEGFTLAGIDGAPGARMLLRRAGFAVKTRGTSAA